MRKVIAVLLFSFILSLSLCAQTAAPPNLYAEVALDTGNGFGSSAVGVRRFQNTLVNVGTDIVYTDSAADGASFEIAANGVYSISYTDVSSTGDTLVVTVNANPATQVDSLVPGNRLCAAALPAGVIHNCSVTLILAAGDVIRAERSIGNTTDYYNYVRFIIVRVH